METTAHIPAKTTQILEAISNGNKTITAISERTGINKRAVNAFIYSLEKQGRVLAASYDVIRAEQTFQVIHKDADPTKGRSRVHPYKTVERKLPHLHGFAPESRPGACTQTSLAPHALQNVFFSLVSRSVMRSGHTHA